MLCRNRQRREPGACSAVRLARNVSELNEDRTKMYRNETLRVRSRKLRGILSRRKSDKKRRKRTQETSYPSENIKPGGRRKEPGDKVVARVIGVAGDCDIG